MLNFWNVGVAPTTMGMGGGWFKSCCGKNIIWLTSKSELVWPILTKGQNVGVAQAKLGWQRPRLPYGILHPWPWVPYGRCGRCHTNFARATPTFCPFIHDPCLFYPWPWVENAIWQVWLLPHQLCPLPHQYFALLSMTHVYFTHGLQPYFALKLHAWSYSLTTIISHLPCRKLAWHCMALSKEFWLRGQVGSLADLIYVICYCGGGGGVVLLNKKVYYFHASASNNLLTQKSFQSESLLWPPKEYNMNLRFFFWVRAKLWEDLSSYIVHHTNVPNFYKSYIAGNIIHIQF